MLEETQMEDIIEDVTEEQLIANEELVQDLPEVSEEQQVTSFSESVKSVLLGEKKAVKEEDDEEDEEDEDEDDIDESIEADLEEAAKEDEDDEEEEDEEKPEVKKKAVKEALDVLMSNESDLSEGFKTEASTLFEAALAEKTVELQERLEVNYNQHLNEEVETIRESVIEKMDSYLSYVVESWVEENTEQVETTLRSDIAENFMTSLKDLFVENYIEVPVEKRDIVEELASTSEDRLSQIVEKEAEIEELAAQVESFERDAVLADLGEDLSAGEQYRLSTILEGVEFESRETFAGKAQTVKESIFETEETVIEHAETYEVEGETEIIIEGNTVTSAKLPASMAQYIKALSK